MRVLGISALPRQRSGSGRGRPDCGRRTGGALHPQEARSIISKKCHWLLSEGGWRKAGRARSRRVLRQAIPEIRTTDGNLLGAGAARLPFLPDGNAALAKREAVPKEFAQLSATLGL